MRFFPSEYTKIDVGWGFAPDPTGVAYSAYSWFQGDVRLSLCLLVYCVYELRNNNSWTIRR